MFLKLTLSSLAIIIVLFFPETCAAQSLVTETSVTIQVTDSHGRPMEDWQIVSFRDVYGRNWSEAFGENTVAEVPSGEYTLLIHSLHFLPFEGRVLALGPSVVYKAGLQLAGIDNIPPSDTVRGRFELPPGENSWCKLSGLYISGSFFAMVKEDGTFEFLSVPEGTYVLACLKARSPLATKIVDLLVSRTPDIIFAADSGIAEMGQQRGQEAKR